MASKEIIVEKDGVVKTIDASLEVDYVKNGWVVKNTPYEIPFVYDPKKR